jgi:hypothetical protein
MDDQEQALGGGINPRQTVRVGDTIRRPAHVGTPAIQALLQHLEAKNFPAPRAMGIDSKGREILSFIEGRASTWPWPEILLGPVGAEIVGRMLRRYHDAVADFSGPHVWMTGSRAPSEGEVICHGDFAPHNLIWRGDVIAGVIDWELVHPASPIEDVGYAAWMSVPLRPDSDLQHIGFSSPPNRRERLSALARGYGRFDSQSIIEATLLLQDKSTAEMEDRGRRGVEPWKTYLAAGLAERNRRDHAWLLENGRELLD